jgi:hypothetical protein
MVSITYSLKVALSPRAQLPKISGDALVLGSAPNAALTHDMLSNSTIVTANASQATLEQYGVSKPDFTFMRSNMHIDSQVNNEALKALSRKSTKHLILLEHRGEYRKQILCLENIGYVYDNISFLSNLQMVGIIESGKILIGRKPKNSVGVKAICSSFYMGASRVVVAGISLRQIGHSYSESKLKRNHVEADRKTLRFMKTRGLEIISTDRSLSDATGLGYCNPSQ